MSLNTPESVRKLKKELLFDDVSLESVSGSMDNSSDDDYVFDEEGESASSPDVAPSKPVNTKRASKQLSREPIKIYLRVRPLQAAELAANQQSCVVLEDQQHAKISAPKGSLTYKNCGPTEEKYTFTRAFNEDTEQRRLFGSTTLPLIESFLWGSDALIFAYGVTNAGKTFTIQGSEAQPGVIPRALDVVFNSIARVSGACGDVSVASAASVASTASVGLKDTSMPVSKDYTYAVSIGYAEIYCEDVFDLLAPPPSRRDEKRKKLVLRKNREGELTVVGAQDVTVASRDEAMALIQTGQQNRQVAETLLNVESSRSHSVLTVRLVATPIEKEGEAVGEVRTSKLSIIDLAGSERSKKTQARGSRLKEASNINTSLMTLGKCLEVLRQNQTSKTQMVVPFRESKLTMLLQDYYMGDGKVAMLVNVSPSGAHFEETLHVLRFSAIAKDVTTMGVPRSKIDTGRGRIVKKKKDSEASKPLAVPRPKSRAQLREAEMLAEIEELRLRCIDAEENAMSMEAQIRDEVAEEMAERLGEMEEMYRKRHSSDMHVQEETYEKKVHAIERSTVKRQDRHTREAREAGLMQSNYEELLQQYEEVVRREGRSRELLSAKDQEIESLKKEVEVLREEASAAAMEHAAAIAKVHERATADVSAFRDEWSAKSATADSMISRAFSTLTSECNTTTATADTYVTEETADTSAAATDEDAGDKKQRKMQRAMDRKAKKRVARAKKQQGDSTADVEAATRPGRRSKRKRDASEAEDKSIDEAQQKNAIEREETVENAENIENMAEVPSKKKQKKALTLADGPRRSLRPRRSTRNK